MAKGVRAVDIEYTPSKKLAVVIGSADITRGQMMKKIWAYIKKHDLQSKKDKRVIIADEKLRPVFGEDKLNMFQMVKKLSKHIERAN